MVAAKGCPSEDALLRHVLEAANNLQRAGFRQPHLEVNGYCVYGLPGERISSVVQTALLVSDVVGSIIPMLFAPVPSTQLFEKYLEYYRQRGWCNEYGRVRDLHLLSGKLFPFLQMNEGSVEDYVGVRRRDALIVVVSFACSLSGKRLSFARQPSLKLKNEIRK